MARPGPAPGTIASVPGGGRVPRLFARTVMRQGIFPLQVRNPQARPTASAPALQKSALPCQRVRDDGGEIVELRLPSERGRDAVACRDDLRRIARPAAGELDLEIDAGDALDRIDHLEHRKAVAVAAIERRRGAAAAQIGERVGMRARRDR